MTALPLQPIDDSARDGRFQIVSDGVAFSVARWTREGFVFSGGEPIAHAATHYYRPECHAAAPRDFAIAEARHGARVTDFAVIPAGAA